MRDERRVHSIRKSALWVALCVAVGAWSPSSLAGEAPIGASVDELLAYAREHNPDLRLRKREAEAARERIESAGALPDPRFQVELMDFTNTMSGGSTSLVPGDVGETRYRVIQPLPFYGKRDLRADVAEALANRSAATVDTAVLGVEARIRTAFVAYYEAAGRTRILRETLDLLNALERLAETRYSVGLVPQQDLIQAQGEITSLKVDLVEAERRRRESAARLNSQLPRAADAPLAVPSVLPPVPASLSLGELFQRAKDGSPDLARERHGIVAAEKGRELAYRNRYPDFAVGLTNSRPRSGTDSWDLMVELNIPLQQTSRRAQERESERLVDAARASAEAAEVRLSGRLGEVLAAFEASRDKARLLADTLLPQARATLDAAQAGYESGRVNFNTLIDAERRVLRARLALLDAEVDIRIRLAELEQLVGAPL